MKNNQITDAAEVVSEEVSSTPETRKTVLTPPGKPTPKEGDIAVTPKGKGLKVTFDKKYGMYQVVFSEGGVLPPELDGKWTVEKGAEAAIERYLRGYWKGRS